MRWAGLLLLALLGSACASTWPARVAAAEARGGESGEEAAARLACARNVSEACVAQGRALLARGQHAEAEAPLVQAFREETPQGFVALAEWHEARGTPFDLEVAHDLREDAPVIDKPVVDVLVGAWVMGRTGALSSMVGLSVQPLAFASRRLAVGAFGVDGAQNGWGAFLGYHHVIDEWLWGVVRGYAGQLAAGQPAYLPSVGVEAGVQLRWGFVGHLEVVAGSTRGAPAYASLRLGLNGVWVLLAMLH